MPDIFWNVLIHFFDLSIKKVLVYVFIQLPTAAAILTSVGKCSTLNIFNFKNDQKSDAANLCDNLQQPWISDFSLFAMVFFFEWNAALCYWDVKKKIVLFWGLIWQRNCLSVCNVSLLSSILKFQLMHNLLVSRMLFYA